MERHCTAGGAGAGGGGGGGRRGEQHAVAMQTHSAQIWCYACDSDVAEADRAPADYNVRGPPAAREQRAGRRGAAAAELAAGGGALCAAPCRPPLR